MKKVLFLLCFITALVGAQVKKDLYVIRPLIKGDFAEGRVEFKNKYFAGINGGEFWKRMVVRLKDSTLNIEGCRIYYFNSDGSYGFDEPSFSNAGNNIYETVNLFRTNEDDEISPLHIIIDLNKKLIKYEWKTGKDYQAPKIVKEYPLKKGKKFPAISVETDNGAWSSGGRKNIVVINWWSADCAPCIKEIPGLNKLEEKYRGKGVEFICIAMSEEREILPQFFKEHPFNYLHGYADKEAGKILGPLFPRNIIIGKDGIILYNKTGGEAKTWEKLDAVIEADLKEAVR